MKLKISAFMLGALACSFPLNAQWGQTATVIYSTPATKNVSIGTADPAGYKLRVKGKSFFDTAVFVGTGLQYSLNTRIDTAGIQIGYAGGNTRISFIKPGNANFRSATATTSIDCGTASFSDISSGSASVVVRSGGIVVKAGISSPNDSTVISGSSIRTKVVYVGTTGWSITAPDYVFKKGYPLMPLSKVKDFIDKNGRLPQVPSAADMEKKGSIDLVEMNMTLLKKIEELTLYTIALEKRIAEHEKKTTPR